MATEEKKQLTEKQEAFLDALCGEARGDIRTAMRMAGYSDYTKTFEVVEPLKNEIIERTSTMLATNAPKATFSIVDVLDDPTSIGARNAVAAAREVLDRAGLVKKELVEVKGPEGGMFILPPKQSEPVDDGQDADSTEVA